MKTISREELYSLVWQTPMYRLGEQFGISGNGLAKICDRLAVPYPPRGYWAKKNVGRAPAIPKLPSLAKGIPPSAQIYPTEPAAKPSVEQQSAGQIGLAKSVDVVVPDDLSHAHRIVREWVAEHKRKQKERAEEHKRRKREAWGWSNPLIDDLTDRDLYRFRVSSAIFSGVEKAGGSIKAAPITGKVTFLIAEQDVECSIVEKLCRPLMMPTGDSAKWTAFPEHHHTGLFSTGFLRVKITSYLGRSTPDWVETRQSKIDAFLPEIIAGLLSAGVARVELQREREEDRRRYLEAEARSQELQRQQALEAERRQKLRQSSDAWHEAMRLRAFIEAVRQSDQEGRSFKRHLPLDDWCDWASSVADEIDPFKLV